MLILTGYASVFNAPYEVYGGPPMGWTETIDRRAFDQTLSEKPDLHLLINHEGMPLARTKSGTLQLSADNHGLKVTAQLDRSDPDVQRIEPKMQRGDMNEMSFRVPRSQAGVERKRHSAPHHRDQPRQGGCVPRELRRQPGNVGPTDRSLEMFTPREQASSIYNFVRSMGRAKVRGADMDEVDRDRLAMLDRAEGTITRAIGTPRILAVEPGDEQLEQMLRHVATIRDALQPT